MCVCVCVWDQPFQTLVLLPVRKHTRGGAEKEPFRPRLQLQHLTAALRAGPRERGSHQTSVPRAAGAGERPSTRGRHHLVSQQGASQGSLLPGSGPRLWFLVFTLSYW